MNETAQNLKTFADAYGIAVRAGVLTPNLEDEKAVRKMFGLPDASPEVVAEWSRTKGVRLPITLSKDLGSEAAQTGATTQGQNQ
jgi:hypothetical protein